MPFSDKCLEMRDNYVQVTPFHSYGWSHSRQTDCQDDYQPEPFKLRIVDFLIWGNTVAVLQGKIEQPGHKYDGYWVTSVPRIDDKYIDFDSNSGVCGVVISPQRALFDASSVPPNHPAAVQPRGEPFLRGHATIAMKK